MRARSWGALLAGASLWVAGLALAQADGTATSAAGGTTAPAATSDAPAAAEAAPSTDNPPALAAPPEATPTPAPKAANAPGDPAAGANKIGVCAGCHGPDGNSFMPSWPKLAGQNATYIVKQLQDFKAGNRNDPMMSGVAMGVLEEDIADIAAFFSSQVVSPSTPPEALVHQGEVLYRQGNARSGVIACVACHGLNGEGLLAGIPNGAPSVRGQHTDYLTKAINDFKAGARTNDFKSVMQTVAKKLSDQDIAALAAYMSSLATPPADGAAP